MSEYNTDYYRQINAEESPQAERLADILIWKYQPKRVIDVGCATGLYLKPFLDRGVTGQGVDFSEAAVADEVLMVPRKLIKITDITKQPIGLSGDLAICLEVLEHIPASGARAAIANLTKASDLIIFSAAQPGQGGVGHINCQPKEYWQELFEQQGFWRRLNDEGYIKTLIAAGYHLGWLINNLMIFGPARKLEKAT